MSAYELPGPFAAFQFNSGWRSWEQVVPGAIGEFGVVSAYTADQMHAAFEAGRLQERALWELTASGQAVERDETWKSFDRDVHAFVDALPELLKHHKGKYALIYEGMVTSPFDSYEEVLKVGYQTRGLQGFLVQKIEPVPELLPFPLDQAQRGE